METYRGITITLEPDRYSKVCNATVPGGYTAIVPLKNSAIPYVKVGGDSLTEIEAEIDEALN